MSPSDPRPLKEADFDDAMALYRDLLGDIPLPEGDAARVRFAQILTHPGTQILGATIKGGIRAMATLHILPNMTFAGRPYGLIENVITHHAWQGQGLGRAVMQAAIARAWQADAYKIMLLTGQTAQAKGFYEKLGFNADQKHGMILRRAPQRRPAPLSSFPKYSGE